jgi:signal transduction histidine kinase
MHAKDLAWLSPCAASLVALARAPRDAWPDICADPGCVLLLVRYGRTGAGASLAASTGEPSVLAAALEHLSQAECETFPIYQASWLCARLTQELAQRANSPELERAWMAGLLAPLGRLADAAAPAPRGLASLPAAPRSSNTAAPHRFASLARGLSLRWNLPAWLAAVTGHLGLPLRIAETLGADPLLFPLVQLAVALAQERGHPLGLPVGAGAAELVPLLGLSAGDLDAAWSETVDQLPRQTVPASWESPYRQPLLAELLRMALANRRLERAAWVERLETDLDALHRTVAEQKQTEEQRLERMKLEALAELAAGAGHEINNPLAVISGQAQYLLGQEMETSRRRSLQTIVNQANRIHQTLTDLMQFARPMPARRQPIDVARLMREVSLSLQGLATDRQVRLICCDPAAPYHVHADPGQLQTALTCLVRNAIEAAPPEGWAGVRAERTSSDQLELIVEDNGRGPTASDRLHLFDPFYSGRKAGRGRGLGLSTAWRLAQQNHGEVGWERTGDGLTRFVLRLPGLTVAAVDHPSDVVQRNGVNVCHRAQRE